MWVRNLISAGRYSARLINVVGVLLYAGVMFAINAQVFMRYVVERPVRWSEELPIVLLTFSVFLMLSLRVKQEDHVSFDLVFNVLPAKAKEVVNLLAQVFVCVAFALALPGILDFANYMRSLSTPILRIPYNVIYYFFVLLVASIVLRSAWSAITSARTLHRLMRP